MIRKRAIIDERTTLHERAETQEGTNVEERAMKRERTTIHERASMSMTPKRAKTPESTNKIERAKKVHLSTLISVPQLRTIEELTRRNEDQAFAIVGLKAALAGARAEIEDMKKSHHKQLKMWKIK